ncbi:hypothetical protein QG37_00326 [Candidozyma auris]|nr:hypothetical protein QG37_00326 [[Candida] auris]
MEERCGCYIKGTKSQRKKIAVWRCVDKACITWPTYAWEKVAAITSTGAGQEKQNSTQPTKSGDDKKKIKRRCPTVAFSDDLLLKAA